MSGHVGRESAVAGLHLEVDRLASGSGRLVLVVGEAGIGKTSLVTEVAEYAARCGVDRFWATCWDGDDAPPYWPWVQILRDYATVHGPVGAEVARIMPRLDGSLAAVPVAEPVQPALREAATDRFAVFDDVSALLARAARQRPLIVVLDDLQWSDLPSLRLLEFMAGRLRSVPILLVGIFRDDEDGADRDRRDLLIGLRRQSEVTALAGLSESDVARLMELVSGTNPGSDLTADVFRRTAGNPFFIREVTQLLVSRGQLDDSGLPGGIPDGVRQAVEQRLARLPQDCVSLLTVAAAVGPESGLDLLARVAGHPPDIVIEGLEHAVRARILAPPASPAGPYRFAHDLFRETLYDQMSSQARAAMHGGIAEALEVGAGNRTMAPHPAELAHHFLLAAIGQRSAPALADKSIDYCLAAAAEAVERLAYEDAVASYSRTLDALGLAGVLNERARLIMLLNRADAQRRSGELAAAGRDFRMAGDLARISADGEGIARAALGIHALGVKSGTSRSSGIQLLDEALDALADEETALQAQVLAALARELFLVGVDHRVRAATLSRAAVEIARRVGDYSTLAGCLLAAHDVLWLPGKAAQRRAIAIEMGAAAQRAGDHASEAEACLLRASAALEIADPAGLRDLEEFFALGEALAQPRYAYLVLTRRAMRATLLGRFAETEQLIADAGMLAEAIGELDAWNVQTRMLWELRSAQGQRALAEAQLRTCAIPEIMSWFDGLVGLALLDRGERSEARVLIAAAVQRKKSEMPYIALVLMAELGEAAAAIDLKDACQRYYDDLSPYAGTVIMVAAAVGFGGAVDHHLGILAAALGRVDEAVRHLERAAIIHERLTAWPWLARTRCELATVLAGRGAGSDQLRVETLVAQVGEAAEQFGMPGLLARLTPLRRPPDNVFLQEGDTWLIRFDGRDSRLRDAKGLADIAALLRAQGQEVPATVLAGQPAYQLDLGADPMLDHRAQREYRSRLALLDRDFAAAEGADDQVRAAELTDERAFLLRELSSAVGLGHRDRGLGDDRERARKAVTARIKDSLHRLETEQPALAAHLNASITTGNFCGYRPIVPVRWRC